MFELTNDDVCDIAVTAAEGGIGYWSQIDVYEYARWTVPDRWDYIEVPDTFVFYNLAELSPEGTHYLTNELLPVTPAVIRRGWNRLVERWGNRSLNPFGFDPRDSGSVDSVVADLIIQLGLFDEVRYG